MKNILDTIKFMKDHPVRSVFWGALNFMFSEKYDIRVYRILKRFALLGFPEVIESIYEALENSGTAEKDFLKICYQQFELLANLQMHPKRDANGNIIKEKDKDGELKVIFEEKIPTSSLRLLTRDIHDFAEKNKMEKRIVSLPYANRFAKDKETESTLENLQRHAFSADFEELNTNSAPELPLNENNGDVKAKIELSDDLGFERKFVVCPSEAYRNELYGNGVPKWAMSRLFPKLFRRYLYGEEDRNNAEFSKYLNRRKKIAKWLGVLVTVFVAAGEFFIPMMFTLSAGVTALPLLPFIAMPALVVALIIGFSGGLSNFVLFRDGCYQILRRLFIDGLLHDADGKKLESTGLKATVIAFGGITAISTASMGVLGYFAVKSVLLGASMSAGLAIGLGVVVGLFTFAALGCAILNSVADLIINCKTTWKNIKSFFTSRFGRGNHPLAQVRSAVALLAAVGILVFIPIVMYGIYFGTAMTVVGYPIAMTLSVLGTAGYVLFVTKNVFAFTDKVFKFLSNSAESYAEHCVKVLNNVPGNNVFAKAAYLFLHVVSLGILTGLGKMCVNGYRAGKIAWNENPIRMIYKVVFAAVLGFLGIVIAPNNAFGQSNGINEPTSGTSRHGATVLSNKLVRTVDKHAHVSKEDATKVGQASNFASSLSTNVNSAQETMEIDRDVSKLEISEARLMAARNASITLRGNGHLEDDSLSEGSEFVENTRETDALGVFGDSSGQEDDHSSSLDGRDAQNISQMHLNDADSSDSASSSVNAVATGKKYGSLGEGFHRFFSEARAQDAAEAPHADYYVAATACTA